MSDVVIIHTADAVADILGVDYKTVLNLIKRGYLQALPGLRHKRITDGELNRYLGVQPAATSTPAPAAPAPLVGTAVPVPTRPLVNHQQPKTPVRGGIKREPTPAANKGK